ncbi:hypothetical protein OSB04_003185 [Centaurea solstitialis]|uniref:CCHC-type domain-containing protein n=1 Tax=Centaurea solstitialis TaxID=347529 RepID=A0AA38TW59_9ASTR|nr:hypothetical protein OSB04_003185 [Centaurea solstitialis]
MLSPAAALFSSFLASPVGMGSGRGVLPTASISEAATLSSPGLKPSADKFIEVGSNTDNEPNLSEVKAPNAGSFVDSEGKVHLHADETDVAHKPVSFADLLRKVPPRVRHQDHTQRTISDVEEIADDRNNNARDLKTELNDSRPLKFDNYFDTGSLGKPPRFNKENFALWKTRMELFLSGADPRIPYFLEHGPYVPTQTVHGVPATDNEPVIPPREMEKPVPNWSDEDRRLVSIDTKYESFIHLDDETLSQTHQRFNCLLIDLKTIGTVYSNSEVITKFMESLLEYWETYTSYLTMSKDIKTITLSELYGILLNREQQKKLKKNLIRDTKDSKSTSLALVSDSVPHVSAPSSLVTITDLESSDSNISILDPDFNESLAFLTRTFKKFARKGNFQRRKPLTLTDKPKSDYTDKATSTCYNCQSKGHFANICRYKKNQFASSSKNPNYQKLKEKYKKMKSQRKGKGLVVEDCDWDDVSSDEEDTQVALMGITDEPTLAIMAKIEEVPEEAPPKAPEASTSATESSSQIPSTYVPLKSLT